MREIITHNVVGFPPSALKITATGEPGPGGANNRYSITGMNMTDNQAAMFGDPVNQVVVLFQNGDPAVNGINGVTLESLIAIAADRLEGFQMGPYPCPENDMALQHLQAAMMCLHSRTRKRDKSALMSGDPVQAAMSKAESSETKPFELPSVVVKMPGIKPDPDAVVALALSGSLPDQQAGEILQDAFAPSVKVPVVANLPDGPALQELCKKAAEAAGKNASVAPQLLFGPIYLTLKEAIVEAESNNSPTTKGEDDPYKNVRPNISREMIFKAMEHSGFNRTHACCEGVPLKLCANDQYKGNLGVFATKLVEAATEDLQRRYSCVKLELEDAQRRYTWAANELLACDYGENDKGKGVIGWHVYGWRNKDKDVRIYGESINIAIDTVCPPIKASSTKD